jgi:hypothetical protein
MRSINVKVNDKIYNVEQDRCAYRIRFFVREFGYIGSFYPQTKIVRFCSTDGMTSTAIAVRGKITGIKELIKFQMEIWGV